MPRAESWPENLGAVPSLAFARPARVLLALTEGDRRELLAEALEDEGYEVQTASTGPELKGRLAGSVLAGEPFDLMVLDLETPGLQVLEVLGAREVTQLRLILIARRYSDPINLFASRLRAVVLDNNSSAHDLCDCAVTLVSPVKANDRRRAL